MAFEVKNQRKRGGEHECISAVRKTQAASSLIVRATVVSETEILQHRYIPIKNHNVIYELDRSRF